MNDLLMDVRRHWKCLKNFPIKVSKIQILQNSIGRVLGIFVLRTFFRFWEIYLKGYQTSWKTQSKGVVEKLKTYSLITLYKDV